MLNLNIQNQGGKQPKRQTKNSLRKSMKILILCLLFGLLIMLIINVLLFYIIQNPVLFKGLGIERGIVAKILHLIPVIFLGLLFFLAIILVIMNSYRLITNNSSRIKNSFGVFLGLILIIFSLLFGYHSLWFINSLPRLAYQGSLVEYYMLTKDDNVLLDNVKNIIAPVNISFSINKTIFNQQIGYSIGGLDNIIDFTIDCGNGQSISLGSDLLFSEKDYFNGTCLFINKGEYPIKFTYHYLNQNNNTQVSNTFSLSPIKIDAAIKIGLPSGNWELNEKSNEILVGDVPVLVKFDPDSLFTDLNISDPKIFWDFDGDSEEDQEADSTPVSYKYNDAGLYDVMFSLPGFDKINYFFRLRVSECPCPKCQLNMIKEGSNKYRFVGIIIGQLDVKNYHFYIIDDMSLKQIYEKKNLKEGLYVHEFNNKGVYKVRMKFETTDGEIGSCDSKVIDISQ